MKNIFETKSVFITMAWCVLTFGLFFIYRLYTFTAKVNPHTHNPISKHFAFSAISIHLVSFFSLFIYLASSAPPELLLFSKAIHVISSAFHLVWLVKIRNRINALNDANPQSKLWLNPILCTFFHVIYIQHKINQANTMEFEHAGKHAI